MTKSILPLPAERPRRFPVWAGSLCSALMLSACPQPTPMDGPEPDPVVEPDGPYENGTIGNLAPAANDPVVHSPFDATLSPGGEDVYYLALGRDDDGDQVPGVFHVPAAGGAPATLALGDPLEAPAGLDITIDGSRLVIADVSALDDDERAGALLSLPVSGGAPSALAGTEGYAPAGVVVAVVDGEERAYFTGRDPSTSEAGVFMTSVEGGSVQSVAQGAPFASPGGIAVNQAGVVYVVDGDPSDPAARVLQVEGGAAEVLLTGIGVGYPAGIALSKDESVILVSGIDPVAGTDIVYRVVLDSLEVGTLSEGIDTFAESAGLHRAHDAEAYAWADSEASGTGTVFVLTPPTPAAD